MTKCHKYFLCVLTRKYGDFLFLCVLLPKVNFDVII